MLEQEIQDNWKIQEDTYMKGKSQMSLFVGDMIECINNLQKFYQAIPTPDKHFQQKDLLYANDKRTEKEISQH